MATATEKKLLTTQGMHGLTKLNGQVRAHVDDMNIHRDNRGVSWWAPIGNVVNTTVLGYFVNHASLSPSGGVAISTGSGDVTISIGATAAGGTGGIRSLVLASKREYSPTLRCKFKVSAITSGVQTYMGFYASATSYCYVQTSGAVVKYLINDTSGAVSGQWEFCSDLYIDSNLSDPSVAMAADTYIIFELDVDTAGKPTLVYETSEGARYVYRLPSSVTERMTAIAHYWELWTQAAASANKMEIDLIYWHKH